MMSTQLGNQQGIAANDGGGALLIAQPADGEPPPKKRVRRERRPGDGWTVTDIARRHRVSESKVLSWISRGELAAFNTAGVMCGRPRWVVSPEALAEFERKRAAGPPPKSQRRRRRRPTEIDYFAD
jgi:hypothetical protein